METVDVVLRDRLEYVVGLLVKKLEGETKPEAIEAISKCLQGFFTELREMEAIPTQSAYMALAKEVSDLKAWRDVAQARLGIQTFGPGRAGEGGLGRF